MTQKKAKKFAARQRQAKNLIIVEMMQTTGWTRERVVTALNELETVDLLRFPAQGGMMLKVAGK